MKGILGILFIIISYFIGNISPSTILAKRVGLDIKKEGSGNAGTTNALRVLGKKAALITLIVDVGKGFLVVMIAKAISPYVANSFPGVKEEPGVFYLMLCGLAVFLGHIFPVLYGFKGGKGVATAFGVVLGYHWQVALILLFIVVLIVALTRMVSLGSIGAAVGFLPLEYFLGGYSSNALWSFLSFVKFHWPFVIMVIALIVKHRGNILRIIKGEENKISFSSKDK